MGAAAYACEKLMDCKHAHITGRLLSGHSIRDKTTRSACIPHLGCELA